MSGQEELPRVCQWAVEWAVNCPRCDFEHRNLEELIYGSTLEIECECGQKFIVTEAP